MTKKAIKETKETKAIQDSAPVVEPPKRTLITFMLSEKGGMGKTTVGLVAAEQMTAAKHPFFLIDADASTPNVGLTYRKAMYEGFKKASTVMENIDPPTFDRKGSTVAENTAPSTASRKGSTTTKKKEEVINLQEQITFTGNSNDYFLADQILDIAKKQDVLIVMPSQVAAYLNRWIEQNDVLGMLADPDNTIDIVFFFITNGTPESMELFVESVEASQGKIQHVLVKNLGASTNIRWQRFDADGKIRAFLAKHEFQSIYFPEILIAPDEKNKILSEYIPWGEALSSDWISFSTKRRLNKCLKEATQALGSTGLIPYHPDYIPEAVLIAEAEAKAQAEIEAKAQEAEAEAALKESEAPSPPESLEKVGADTGVIKAPL